ncbi:hypothetical protein [Halorubellus litoreus]|uniref:Uncharacterized protein n=1 Tax=Halorubellus litoreus TaxID=755308 RepID=A0ABD5VH97_9EURY
MTQSLFAAEGDTSEYVTTATNDTGNFSPVLEISPDDGVGLILRNSVAVGQKLVGFPVYADLRDSNGDPLPNNTRVALAYESPTDNQWQIVSVPLANIRSFNEKSITDQQKKDNVDSVKLELEAQGTPEQKAGQTLEIRDIDTAYVLVESSVQIDHSKSEIYVDSDAVEEVDIE